VYTPCSKLYYNNAIVLDRLMMKKTLIGIVLMFLLLGCVDRLFYDITTPNRFGLSISGHITDDGGPHRVNVFRNFDTESRDSLKTGVSAKRVVISDADGNTAELSQVVSGVYETKAGDMTGRVGGIYKVTVELDDGRVYESKPDTLPAGGAIDTAYYKFVGRATPDNYIYEYEIYFNANRKAARSQTFFSWSNKMTYKSLTHPEYDHNQCYPRPDAPAICNFVPPCTGIKNVGTSAMPSWDQVGPCTCCTCWYDQYSPYLLLSDNIPPVDERYSDVLVDRIKQTGWNMMYKMRIEIMMQSLSLQSYRFWKTVRDQRSATTNIFQPITGKIQGNIVQVSGADVPVEGVFYATSVNSKVFYIVRGETPTNLIPSADFGNAIPCTRLAPNARTTMPSYWIE